MSHYYREKLSGARLRCCYEVAPERVVQYLEAEIAHASGLLGPEDVVLELGCGYGRVARRLAPVARRVVGIDNAPASLELAVQMQDARGSCEFACMDALRLGFPDRSFDAVVCLQNGICAFGVDPASLLEEALRVTRDGGIVLCSSYADRFWRDRLAWFQAQAAAGLIGPIDLDASGTGFIVCEDGFRAGRLTPDDLHALCARIGVTARVTEVDGSSVFCEIHRGDNEIDEAE